MEAEQLERLDLINTKPETLQFLRAVLADPQNPVQQTAEKNAEKLKNHRDNQKIAHTLDLNIMASYLLTSARLEDVGKIYGISKQGTQEAVMRVMKDLHQSSSTALQKEFPIEAINNLATKKILLHNSSLKLARAILKGENYEKLSQSSNQVFILENRLQTLGFKVSLPRKRKSPETIMRELARAKTDKEIIIALQKITNTFRTSPVIERSSQVIATIKQVAENFTFSPKNTYLFVKSLREAGIFVKSFPGGRGYYHVIAMQHLERARQVLDQDPNLARFKKHN